MTSTIDTRPPRAIAQLIDELIFLRRQNGQSQLELEFLRPQNAQLKRELHNSKVTNQALKLIIKQSREQQCIDNGRKDLHAILKPRSPRTSRTPPPGIMLENRIETRNREVILGLQAAWEMEKKKKSGGFRHLISHLTR
jgi:hypothetical protein